MEWFSKENGRVVIELEQNKVKLLGKPLPACEIEPIPRDELARTMAEFLAELAKTFNISAKNTVCIGRDTDTGDSKKEVRG